MVPAATAVSTPAVRTWSSAIGAITLVVSMLGILTGALWTYAGVSYAAQSIPTLKIQQDVNSKDIAVLQEARRNSDLQYAEILSQLGRLGDKIDRINEVKK